VNLRGADRLSPPDTAAAVGLALMAAGLAALADALVEAAPSSGLSAADRLAYGLWSVRMEHGLVFTAGLAMAWWGLSAEARLGGWRDPALRLATGLSFGLAALAVAVVLAATDVALRGHVGSGLAELQLSGRQRTFGWLRQVVTAGGFGLAWVLLGVQLNQIGHVVAADHPVEPEPSAAVAAAARLPTPEPLPDCPTSAPSPPSPPPVSQERAKPAPPAVSVPGTDTAGGTLSGRAQHTYRTRLAYSPRGVQARELADRIQRLEGEGRTAEAERLLAELEAL
jgi:hypothetical protein